MIDVEMVYKGFTLTRGEVLRELEVVSPEHLSEADIQFIALKFAKGLEDRLFKAGRKWTVQARDGEVRVLTDSEALSYRRRQNLAGLRKIKRSMHGYSGIDTQHLSEQERSILERESTRASMQVSALRRIRPHASDIAKSQKSEPPIRITRFNKWG